MEEIIKVEFLSVELINNLVKNHKETLA